jgi:DinB family.
LTAYEKNAGELEKRLAMLDDAAWEQKARFLVDGNVAWETTLGDMLWGFLFDAIHHRGQLSSYLRPIGAAVPSIYGPSADDPGM